MADTLYRFRHDRMRRAGAQRGQCLRDTTAKLIAIAPVAARAGASGIASPKRTRRPRPPRESGLRTGAASRSSPAVQAFTVADSTASAIGRCIEGPADMEDDFGKDMPVLNALPIDQ
ncbi:hypothetical protein [Burkholderia ubonensis]|uniref:hypothetical protein n=1 Tax=Burkholderia ubonensis TaxID=101571 RepID=UPI00076C129E|nr:hypothetical protein [Burkholderia ubonensis]KUZ92944.1 hypothetical protein WI40_22295 [Burkholderia ubonensis]KVA39539.1 hypothetical protein WI46_15630 [Burkholderia ubonensis]